MSYIDKIGLKGIKITEKSFLIAILSLILLLISIVYPLVLIIIVSIFMLITSFIFPILYFIKLQKQTIPSEDYYLKFVEKNYSNLNENLLIKMFEIRINNQRNFLFSYLALLATFTFVVLSNREYFKTLTYGILNMYYYDISIGIIGILILVYVTYGFDRYTLKELEILFKAIEKLKHLNEK